MARSDVEAFLNRLAGKHGGHLTPEMVVDAARPKDSPIHGHFEWDSKKAAYAHWLYQARALIRSVHIEVTTTQMSVRAPAFVRDPAMAGDRQGFVSVAQLRDDEDLAREAVVAEFSRASAALERAKAVAAALDLTSEIERIQDDIGVLSERARQEGQSSAAAA